MFILAMYPASQNADPARGESSAMIPGDAACYSCHAEETALDQVFGQFYPALRHMLP